jgi:hypothetical protein
MRFPCPAVKRDNSILMVSMRLKDAVKIVMAGLVPAIHAFSAIDDVKAWMPGTRLGMTS